MMALSPRWPAGSFGTLASKVEAAILATSPVAYWRLNDGSGVATLADKIGSHDLTVVGTGVTAVAGVDSSDAEQPDDATSYAEEPTWTTPPTSAITVAAWYQPPASNPTDYWPVAGWRDDFDGDAYLLDIFNNTTIEARIGNSTGITTLNAACPHDGNWHYLALTWDGVNVRLYIDGVLAAGPTARNGVLNASNPFRLWHDSIGPFESPRPVDEVAVWDRALSLTEVQSIYNAGV